MEPIARLPAYVLLSEVRWAGARQSESAPERVGVAEAGADPTASLLLGVWR